jgi:hypothetical protein
MAVMRIMGQIGAVRIWMRMAALAGLALTAVGTAVAGDQFTAPTPAELAMKDLPGYPGAPAVVLYRDQIAKDDLHVVQHYDRIKILTEEGKKYANVELRYVSVSDDGSYYSTGDDKTMGEVSGRTIHPDGTIIPFTGKPYKKTMEKTKEVKYQAIVFTLPDVEVGSIIEYRYATRINDNVFESPSWFIQGDLYLKSAHFGWLPTTRELQDSHGIINTITWFPVLPPGAKIVHNTLPGTAFVSPQQSYDLVVNDVPPQVKEDYMPPIASFSYRVLFNFSSYRTAEEYWKSEGKDWSKRHDSFTNPNGDLKKITDTVTAGAASNDEKLRKIYAAVQKLENTEYTRAHEQREDKAAGVGKLNSVADVWKRERGGPTELAELFVGMARAAGMKAYLMLVPDRSEELFVESWLSFEQFDSTIAIVNVDGKEVFFDPGSRYCPYGQLAWEHTMVEGLRQTDGGTAFAQTVGEQYSVNKTARVANLEMNEQGEITGKIDLTFSGAPALNWRHRALRGDEESLKNALRTHLEDMLPKSLEVKVLSIQDLDAYEKPLAVSYEVKGSLGTATGKRLVLPVDLFEAGSTPAFPHEKRELAVYFRYPEIRQDALRIKFTKGFAVEAVPEPAKFTIPSRETYSLTVESTPTSFTTRRTYADGDVLVKPDQYAELRKFHSQFEGKDQESVVLKVAPVQSASVSPSGN